MSPRRARTTDHHDHEHDLGLVHDMGVLTRRRALLLAGFAGASAVVACAPSPGRSTVSSAMTAESTPAAAECVAAAPQETQGPYPGDGSNGPNVLIESGIVRSDIRPSFGPYSGVAQGVPLSIELHLKDLTKDCSPGTGMAIYIWQCDREGRYSLYSDGATDQNYLRGVQVADGTGKVSFTSIFPACYPGRWPHIHFEVFDSLESAVAGENARLTSQIAFPKDSCDLVFSSAEGYSASVTNLARLSLERDNVFGDGWDAELATVTGDTNGMALRLTIGVGEKTEAARPSGPPPGGPPPGGPPPGMRPPR